MPDVKATPVSLKCKVCGGDIRNDYLAGTCACMNCGNRWSLADIIPDYTKYSKIIANINNANSIVETGSKATSANEAKLLFKTAIMECNRFNDHVSADLINVCEEGVRQTELLGCYIKGKTYYEKRSYSSAVRELAKVPGYRDADVIVEICKEEIEKERKKQIPWAVVFSLIIPAAVGLFLREQFGCPWAVCIILFLLGSAGLGYVLYRGGVISVIIKIVSFLAATPLILYSILAYGFHMKSSVAVVIAIVGPIVMFILFASFTEQITKKNK
jgi:hypothetical protein